ncbi:hypothetical protein F2P81_017401 [Scophthalmus maximus]|uniref:Uncharacterized protein n=1 Tax=Scophthalmus maximus TaxID=52904 RepID=A0A6A4SFN6_SCOMX|nr:hypothetical protein F2P81_017401 [Scophthalmus maximus]
MYKTRGRIDYLQACVLLLQMYFHLQENVEDNQTLTTTCAPTSSRFLLNGSKCGAPPPVGRFSETEPSGRRVIEPRSLRRTMSTLADIYPVVQLRSAELEPLTDRLKSDHRIHISPTDLIRLRISAAAPPGMIDEY